MDAEIKDTIISCPACGTPGSFTCTNCRHQVRFSLQWNGQREGWEDVTIEPQGHEPEKGSSGPHEGDSIEEPLKQVRDQDILESKLKQVLFDEIKTSLQEDIKNAISEAVSAIKKDLLNELKHLKGSKVSGTEGQEPEKGSSGPPEGDSIEEPSRDTRDKDKKEDAVKTEGRAEELNEPEPGEKTPDPDEGETWNKSVYII